MANTDITLRLDKGSTLTFNEMDTNFTSFFYSASTHVVEGANKLRLFYTGSGNLDSPFNAVRYTELALPSATSTGGSSTDPAGSDRQIQFNNNGVFGASSLLKFTETSNSGPRLGVGVTPRFTLDLQSTNTSTPTIFNLNASNNTANSNSKAYIQFKQGGSTFAQLGKRNTGNNIIDFYVKSQLNLGTHNYDEPIQKINRLNVSTGGVVIGESLGDTVAPGTAPLAIIGDIGIGSDTTVSNTSFIGASNVGGGLLPSDSVSNGLLIQSPKSTDGGHVIIGINTDSGNNESFSIVKGSAGSFDTQIATFGADGKVGIGNINPKEVLHVNGNITGSGNFSVDGTAHIKTTQTGVHTDKALVITDKGQVKQMVASPIPLGGIIMWSGLEADIPTGWKFCDGNGGNLVNGITIPDLRERFIRSAGSSTDIGELGGQNCFTVSNSNINQETFTTSPDTHFHYIFNDAAKLDVNSGVGVDLFNNSNGSFNTSRRNCSIVGNAFDQGSNAFDYEFSARGDYNTYPANAGKSSEDTHTHTVTIGVDEDNTVPIMNIPRYFALAFIIYVGA